MANQKGNTTGAGRKAGMPNKATAQAREAIAAFVDGNADRLTGWLDKIAEENPKDAFSAFMSVVEYHIPKLARTDNTTTVEVKASLPQLTAEEKAKLRAEINAAY